MTALLFLRLQFLKALRSVSLSRNLVGGFFLGLISLLLFIYIIGMAFALHWIISDLLGYEDSLAFINTYLLFLLAGEFFYRFFLQKLPVFELHPFLHLPIPKSRIVHFLLRRSFLSLLNLVMIVLFTPYALMQIAPEYGNMAALSWLGTIVLVSWSVHWLVLWFKQRMGDGPVGLFIMFLIYFLSFGAQYFGWYNAGELMKPLFDHAIVSPVSFLGMIAVFGISYGLAYGFYRSVIYVEELSASNQTQVTDASIGFLSRFGISGALADAEWKLILRHKKSRAYLIISILFLLYGLIFYLDPNFQSEDGFSHFYIFIGIFITGIFIIQYGQLFLSWNSANFDFFIINYRGIESLVNGKYLLFVFVSVICFILTVPYVYFGLPVLMGHMATFLFNLGVTMHLITLMALWKPKPMDINKGAMFNYEGVGASQFLMFIPLMVIPYAIYLPFALIFDYQTGLLVLAGTGVMGIIFFRRMTDLVIENLIKNRHEIADSFRQEL